MSGTLGTGALEQGKTYAMPTGTVAAKKQAQLIAGIALTSGKLTSASLSASCDLATANDGEVSRIVTRLSAGAGVVTTRGDVHYVVTEYGIADLHGKNIRERAISLINIAHPKFRADLMREAKRLNYVYEDQVELKWDEMAYPEELER